MGESDFLGSPSQLLPPTPKGQRKQKAKLGSSCSSIKWLQFCFLTSSGHSQFSSISSVAGDHHPLHSFFVQNGHCLAEHPLPSRLAQPDPSPSNS